MVSSASSAATGAVALLDLPIWSTVGVDGNVIVLERNDFVGVYGVPSDSRFHLFTARASSSTTENQKLSALTCGFVVLPVKESEWVVARKYDPHTEEVGSEPLDSLTTENLVKQVQRGQMQQRVVPYNSVISASEIDNWRSQTSFISELLLEKRGLSHGDKVIPGCFEDDMDESNPSKVTDGKPLVFPPIPVLDDSSKLKRTSHMGTKRYLAQLSPSDRTTVFLDEHPADCAFSDVLARHYDNRWEEIIGDIQLSYTMFLHIHCLASLEHWRDLVAMSSTVSPSMVDRNTDLYLNLLRALEIQVTTMEQDFFEDIELSGDNFFIPAIERLCSICSQASNYSMADDVSALTKTLTSCFPSEESNGKKQSEVEELNNQVRISGMDEVKDGPIVVPCDEVEASFARSSQRLRRSVPSNPLEYSEKDRRTYQLLFAAKMEHEDILMTCARILDEKNDVSLVREAAAYLEEVEAKRSIEPWE